MKSGFVSILGRPNVGKSTILNQLLRTKLVAVTSKPQTTRHKIIGILNEDSCQIIFLDTPGIFKPSYRLQKIMVKKAYSSIDDADCIIHIVEPFEFEDEILKNIKKPTVLVINKVDLVKKKEFALPLIDRYKEFKFVKEVITSIASQGLGIEEIKEAVIKLLPEGERYYPEDMLSDRNERFFVSELIREEIFNSYGEEIPYASSVSIDEFKEREPKHFIRAIIYIERGSEKAILIGKDGRALKKVGMNARKNIENFLNHPVYLELWVKVREKWRRNLNDIKEFGYEI